MWEREALAAVGICNPIATLFILFFKRPLHGGQYSHGGISLAPKTMTFCTGQISTTMLSGARFSVFLSVFCIVFAHPILLLMQVDASILQMTMHYMRIIFAGLLFTFMV